MTTLKQLPRTGRPVKIPNAVTLKSFGPLRLLVDDVVKILWKCGAPAGTGLQVKGKVVLPQPRWAEVDTKGRPLKWAEIDEKGYPKKAGCVLVQPKPVQVPVESATRWGQREAVLILKCLFFAPMLLDSSPKDSATLRRIPLSFARLFAQAPNAMIEALPKIKRLIIKRMNSPTFATAFDYAIKRDERFWSEPANVLADEIKKDVRLPITTKGIEHARKMIRDIL